MCQHTDPGMTRKHRDFDPFGSGRYIARDSIVGIFIPSFTGTYTATLLEEER